MLDFCVDKNHYKLDGYNDNKTESNTIMSAEPL